MILFVLVCLIKNNDPDSSRYRENNLSQSTERQNCWHLHHAATKRKQDISLLFVECYLCFLLCYLIRQLLAKRFFLTGRHIIDCVRNQLIIVQKDQPLLFEQRMNWSSAYGLLLLLGQQVSWWAGDRQRLLARTKIAQSPAIPPSAS